MSSRGYAPLPNNPNVDDTVNDELEAAFDDSDDEDTSELHPLNPNRALPTHTPIPSPHVQGTYNFDADYDYPPPGSPPRRDLALPNDHGNTNGITTFTVDSSAQAQRKGWFGRTAAAVLPTHYVQRLGLGPRPIPTGAVGGGHNMDGVFANVTAKPTRAVEITDGENTYMVPEDSQNEAPPSYSSAQADSVPPYWETTVHAPFSPDSYGQMVVDSLPTGSVFSFMWSMLVSISFQFIGFLLTYMLHTTHAARLGSRAGLGVTLIQFGFTLRANMDGKDNTASNDYNWPWVKEETSEEDLMNDLTNNGTLSNAAAMASDSETVTYTPGRGISTNEWLSFFLMTIGWFILLTSLLGFWRVKRWERGILSSQQATPLGDAAAPHAPAPSADYHDGRTLFMISGRDLRVGLGLGGRGRNAEEEYVVHESAAAGRRTADGLERVPLPASVNGQPTDLQMRQALAALRDRNLHENLRAAGLV